MNVFLSLVPIYAMSHYIVEIVGSYKTIIVQVSLCKHLLKLLISHVLS